MKHHRRTPRLYFSGCNHFVFITLIRKKVIFVIVGSFCINWLQPPPIIIIPYNAIPLPNDPVSHWRIKSSFKEIINFFDIECSNSFFLERNPPSSCKGIREKICSKKAKKKLRKKDVWNLCECKKLSFFSSLFCVIFSRAMNENNFA